VKVYRTSPFTGTSVRPADPAWLAEGERIVETIWDERAVSAAGRRLSS
jgi:hypothetical protein